MADESASPEATDPSLIVKDTSEEIVDMPPLLPGADVGWAIKAAFYLSRSIGKPVRFRHNGVDVVATLRTSIFNMEMDHKKAVAELRAKEMAERQRSQ